MKTCIRCKVEKEESEFGKDRKYKSGLSGYCKTCSREYSNSYKERLKSNKVYIFVPEKKCSMCGILKDRSEFYTCYSTKDGLKYLCKSCEFVVNKKCRDVEYYSKMSKEWYKNNPERVSELNWKKKGIDLTYHEYDKLREKQNYCCAICKKHESELNSKLAVDHNHDTLEVRGLLCNHCNSLLGFACDSIETLLMSIEYLKKGK